MQQLKFIKPPNNFYTLDMEQKPKKILKSPEETTGVRLNKHIASMGEYTRREADQLILDGKISVNGKTINTLGTKVFDRDTVLLMGKALKRTNLVYVLLNKPKNTSLDKQNTKAKLSVFDIVKKATSETILPVGHLDIQSTGVLLLTNDSELTERLKSPNNNKKEIFHIYLNKDLETEDLQAIEKGITLEGTSIKPSAISFVEENNKMQLGVEIASSKSGYLSAIFEQLGYKIDKLDRVYFAGLTKKGLQRSHWRLLKKTEIASLKMNSFK